MTEMKIRNFMENVDGTMVICDKMDGITVTSHALTPVIYFLSCILFSQILDCLVTFTVALLAKILFFPVPQKFKSNARV